MFYGLRMEGGEVEAPGGGECVWGLFKGYDDAVATLGVQEKDSMNASVDVRGREKERERLHVEALLVEEGTMLGKQGAEWFTRRWEEGWTLGDGV